jgi:hypothetical protein
MERIRRQYAPVTLRARRSRCDEEVGRFCFWHAGDDSRAPGADHERVVGERSRLLSQLDSAARTIPGDPWIAGQRVRYLLEAGRSAAALAAAERCSAARWWCSALAGYVHHVRGDYQWAERAFTVAFAAMDSLRRCDWANIGLLVRESLRGRYRRLACEERDDLHTRFWWLADPLVSVPGNERRTEHYARLVVNEMLRESATPRRMRWGDDNRELLVRYGWTVGWEREPPSRVSFASAGRLIGHHRSGGRQFAPPDAYVDDPTSIAPGAWTLDPPTPRSVYAPGYAKRFVVLEHQLAVFRRGDSALVVAAIATTDTARAHQETDQHGRRSYRAALALAPDPPTTPVLVTAAAPGTVAATVPWRGMLASVEAFSATDSLGARSRYWLDIPNRLRRDGGISISDILLIRASDPPPRTLADAVPRAVPQLAAAAGATIGLFWEAYDVGSGGTATITLTVERPGKSFVRKAAEWIGIVGARRDEMSLRWQELLVRDLSIQPQGVAVQLTESMRGRYVITVTVETDDGTFAAVARRLLVVPRP